MAPKANPFTEPTKHFLTQVGDLSHCVFVGSVASASRIKKLEADLEEHKATSEKPDRPLFGASSQFPIPVAALSGQKYYYFPGRDDANEHYIQLIAELNGRANAQALSLLFESVEHFIRAFAGKLYFQTRNPDGYHRIKMQPDRKRFHKHRAKQSGGQKAVNTPEYFQQYVEWYTARNCDALIKDLLKVVPGIRDYTTRNGDDVFAFVKVLGQCRHRIVHNNGLISDEVLESFPADWQGMLRMWGVRKSLITEGMTLLPEQHLVKHACEWAGTVGLLLYHLVAEALKLRNDFPFDEAV